MGRCAGETAKGASWSLGLMLCPSPTQQSSDRGHCSEPLKRIFTALNSA